VFMALHHFHVFSVDILHRHLVKLEKFAEQNNVADKVTVVCADIEKDHNELTKLGMFHVVNVARYLHRALFPTLCNLVLPGGLLLYHTFMQGAQEVGPCRPTSDKHLLNDGELNLIFSNPDHGSWEIIVDDVKNISDGRPCSFFIARKIKNKHNHYDTPKTLK